MKVVELFAGAGLLGSAFSSEGFELVRAVEIDRVAAATYAANLGSHVEVADVRKARPTGRCDVLVAGPPCQGFSTLGKRAPDDPRNALTMEIVRWARTLRPGAIVVENVAQFLDSPLWLRLINGLARLGYCITPLILNAVDYGVAQRRRRSFTIALLDRELEGRPERACRSACTVRQAWKGLDPIPNGSNHHVAPAPSPLALARMKVIPPLGDKRDVLRHAPELAAPSWFRTRDEVVDVWGRMDMDSPANTLRTALQNPSKGRYIHPLQNRVISLREAARLHSVPDTWKFVGLPTQVARQIGNSVPPKLGRVVARLVRKNM